ncbi:VOC family protein [Clostridium estertheticum]|uniref:VOC family protein n=1 Tax=Clostridium estertheticum TaxID=238834 RepID=A0A7Y3SZX1_9CLOT|nr:VOC family protein [Clostridium estertheticum]NNU78476.1 VOC family protein [Clostridium estertheticum]WBL49421.1 VOC family protein [Clostridium estertheticum]
MKIKKILTRLYVHDINTSIDLYKKLLNQDCDLIVKYSEMKLELAQIGNILILSGTDEALKPFRDTSATFLVDSVIEFRKFLLKNGAVIVRDLKKVPTGMNFTVKHLDGTIIEYVEHKNINT